MKKILFLLFLFLITIQAGCNVPSNVSIYKDIPVEVTSGDTFNFTVTVKNDDNKEHELRSIDIDESFLDGFYIVNTDPSTKEEYNVWGQQIFEFKSNLPGSSETKVTFTAKALKTGDFSGDLDICIDGDASCLFNTIRIIVK